MRILTACVALIWFFGGLTQLQVSLFGEVYLYSVHVKIFLLAVISMFTVLQLGTSKFRFYPGTRDLRVAYSIWLVYSIIAVAVIGYRFEYGVEYIAFSANALFYFCALIVFLLVLPCDDRRLRKKRWVVDQHWYNRYLVIVALAAPILVLGVAQYLLDDPVFRIEAYDEYLRVISVSFVGGGTRAFSIFTSGWAFGDFAIGMVLLGLVVSVSREVAVKIRVLSLLVFGLGLASVFATLTRMVYLECAAALIGVCLIRGGVNARAVVLSAAGCAVVSTLGVTVILDAVGYRTGDLLDSSSLDARLSSWQHVTSMLGDGGSSILNWLFGVGLIANDRYPLTRGLRVDNLYLGLILYTGLVGLVVTAAFFVSLFRIAVREAQEAGDPLWVAMASFLFAVPTAGIWNVQLNTPFLMVVLIWAMSPPLHTRWARDLRA